MLVVISPAKSLDFENQSVIKDSSQLEFKKEAAQLISELQSLSVSDISILMSLSDNLSQLNYDRFQNFKKSYTDKNAKQAVLAFTGDVYVGMEAEKFSQEEFEYAQDHLRILSGLYGALRPLDLIQPYRLEMGTKFQNTGGKNLYEFWGNKVTDSINKQLKKSKSDILVNLASNEYFKVLKKKDIQAEIITPNFKDAKNGEYKMISFFAKKARGAMTAFIIKNKITSVEGLKGFDWEGYVYNESLSKVSELVFTRG